MLRTHLKRHAILLLVLQIFSLPALADNWKDIAKEQGVELTYEAVGNLARLRFTNSNSEPMTVRWTTNVQLSTGKHVENQAELSLDAGETVVIAGGPYRDAGSPVEIKNVTGTIQAKKSNP